MENDEPWTLFDPNEVKFVLLDTAGRQTDPAKRADFFRQAEAIIVADAPVVPLYYPVKYQLHTERVKGYKLHPVWAMDLTGVSIQ